jgi:hypothetical protein
MSVRAPGLGLCQDEREHGRIESRGGRRHPSVSLGPNGATLSSCGRLGIGQSSPVEVLLYLAAAPLLHQGELTNWPGVTPEALLAEVWAPRARDPRNRDSGQTWLAKNIGRLQEEVARAIGGLATDLVVKQVSGLRLNQKTILSDVEALWPR